MKKTDDSTAHAANWRAVLIVDALVGLVVTIVGVAVAVLVSAPIGIAVVVAGAGYLAAVALRARRWARLRQSHPSPR
jgi:hypothetical protein